MVYSQNKAGSSMMATNTVNISNFLNVSNINTTDKLGFTSRKPILYILKEEKPFLIEAWFVQGQNCKV